MVVKVWKSYAWFFMSRLSMAGTHHTFTMREPAYWTCRPNVIRYLIFSILVYKVNHACMAHDAIELLNDSQITSNTKKIYCCLGIVGEGGREKRQPRRVQPPYD